MLEEMSPARMRLRVLARAVTAGLSVGALAVTTGILAGSATPAPMAKSVKDPQVITKNVSIPDMELVDDCSNPSGRCRDIGAGGSITVNKETKKFTISLHLSTNCENGTFEVYLNGKTTDDKWWKSGQDVKIYDEDCSDTIKKPNFEHTGNWADDDAKVQLNVAFDPTIGKRVFSKKVLVNMLD